MEKIKRAIIIAAGEGKRMRPVTLEMPKPLIQVNGKRIIETGIEALRSNGIHDIYIVVGYKKELFYEIYGGLSDIHLIENPDYLNGNNITSMYYARKYLPGSFVLEADIMINNPQIFHVNVKSSGYMASWKKPATEWVLNVRNKRILDYDKNGNRESYQLFGISVWNKEDGDELAEDIRRMVEIERNTGIYWDEVALGNLKKYHLEVKEITENDIYEIDNLGELIKIDTSYIHYKHRNEEENRNETLSKTEILV